jgi:hypothetical protein
LTQTGVGIRQVRIMGEKDESLSDLLVETCETTIKVTVGMMKMPLKFYADFLKRYAKAVDSALDEFELKK